MSRRQCQGMTLAELLVATTIMTFIALAVAALFQTAIQTQTYAQQRQDLYREAFQIMTRITTGLKNTSHAMVPNGSLLGTSRPLLIFSANINQDNDVYQSNTLFPRFDEDPERDITKDGKPGVINIDDDGELLVDIPGPNDNDDEDLLVDEDKSDGIDNDGDGTVDEDPSEDLNNDNTSGLSGIDDDWDGSIDEEGKKDDDEDGTEDEDWMDPLIYTYTSGTQTLTEKLAATTTTLSTRVSAFTAVYQAPDSTHGPRFLITLALTYSGQTVTLSEYVFPRNTLQRTGKKVR